MTKEQLINLLKTKKHSEIDLTGVDLEGIKSNLKNIDKNEIVFRSGDSASSIYFVIKGEVVITKESDIQTVGEKEYFGLEAINKNTKRTSKAISVKPGIILEILLHDKFATKIKSNVGGLSHTKFYKGSAKTVSGKSFIKNEADSKNKFINEINNDVLTITVKIKKAILIHSKDFLNHMENVMKKGHNKIIVDLTYCEIIDSTFLGVLVKSLKTVTSKKGEIVLVYNQSQSSTLFMITYMDKVFKIFESSEEAVSYFNKQ